jgi:hypothetical protein
MTDEGRRRKKAKFLKVITKNGGFTSKACKEKGVNISRMTLQDWRKKDPVFNNAIEDILEQCGEEIEDLFYNENCKGKNADNVSRMFYLKCKRNFRENEKVSSAQPNIKIDVSLKE